MVARWVTLAAAGVLAACVSQPTTDWPTYGHDPGGQRYSPLEQITPDNVASLRVAWTYHMRPASTAEESGKFASSEVTPLVVRGLLYVTTPYRRVVALDPDTGSEIWAYEVPGPGQPSLRGVEYWPGTRADPPRILFGTRDGRLIALDARSGKSVVGFGVNGVVDLKTPDVMGNGPAKGSENYPSYGLTSPPIVYRNVIITGSATQEFPPRGVSGAVRGWDVVTGKLLWTFHSVPLPGQPGSETWEGDGARERSGVNVWGFMTVDRERGIAFLPFAAPTWDRYGGDRKGANLFGTSLVAVDALTGKYLWHFQVVHHDIWDNDLQAPPIVFDVRKQGRVVPAVAIVSKNGLLFILDRRTGEPIHPVEERAVPASDVPNERTWQTQPFPVRPPPLARNSFSPDELATLTPQLHAFCEEFVTRNRMRSGGPYLPVGYNAVTINFPGLQGGANWGGASFDPARSYLFVNTLDMGQVTSLIDSDGPLPVARGPVSGRFYEPASRLMCQQPPWGRLTAVNVNTGEIAWQSVLGVSDNLPADIQATGRPNVGGSIATAGGLVFIGATDDSRFRAFDAATGRELWTAKLDAAAHATPMTYLGKSGRQFVVVTATGGSFLGSPISSDSIVAFALPKSQSQPAIAHSAAPPPPAPRKVDDLPAGPGRDVLVRSCASCHELGVVLARGRTRPEWAEVTSLMVDRGAVIGADDRELLLDYLAAIAPAH
ncbi:MAG TPA: pyrroloquinoline quinone-dependent dehydrogenase [Steroidobacteraceae bacterium]|nr:pyrroloquinoline quinone-dependent dehydrogenase [Steroidobacteraceae bacterium]